MSNTTPMQGRDPDRDTAPLVMIIDDDAAMRALLRDYLHQEGFAVREHPDGASVIADLEAVQPAVIVLDKEMPGINGLDLLAYIGRRHPTVPVVVVTAFGGAAVRAEAVARGATEYLEKPFRVARLAHTLRLLTERAPVLSPGEV